MDALQHVMELIARDISQIKWLIGGICGLLLIGLCGLGLFLYSLKQLNKRSNAAYLFRDQANEMLDKNDLDGVVRIAQQKIHRFPNDLYARWYLGQAYFRKKEWHKALEEFNLIYEIAPGWRDDYLDPFIAAILEKLKSSKPELVKD